MSKKKALRCIIGWHPWVYHGTNVRICKCNKHQERVICPYAEAYVWKDKLRDM